MPRCSLLIASAMLVLATPVLGQPTDVCGPAAPAMTIGVPMAGDNSSAQTDVFLNLGQCGGFNGSVGFLDVFARFVPSSSGVYRFATCGSAGDTVVSVHSDCPAMDSNLVGCNDDDCDSSSRIDVRLTGGVEYHVRIASNGDNLIPGPFTILVTQLVPPANDECGAAITVAPGSSSAGSNVNATGASMSGCVTDGKDVWYALPVSVSGVYAIDTLGSDHPDTVLGVWTACQDGTELTCNDNDGFSNQSRTAVFLPSGSTYFIRVSGRRSFSGQPAEGAFVLNVSAPQTRPANDLCSSATPVLPGSATAGDTGGATLSADSAACADNDFYDVWYTLTVPVRAQYVVSLQPAGGFDAVLSVMDNCGGSGLGCSNQFGDESVTAVLEAGTPYLVRVAGTFHSRGAFTLSVDNGTLIPANDACGQATPVGLGQVAGTNRAATGSDLTPSCAFDDSADVWYVFTAPSAGLYTFDTTLSTVLTDTSLSLFASCGGEPLVCSDNTAANASPADFTSRIAHPMGAGQQVLVRVAGMGASVGEFVLRIGGPAAVPPAPSNDECTGARAVTGLSYTDSVDARFAATDMGSECNFGDLGETFFGVWYVYTAVERGILTFTETGPVQASVTAFEGTCGGGLSPLFPLQCGEVTREVAPGDVLYFLVGSEGTEAPALPFVVSATLRPQLGCCVSGAGCALVAQSACTGSWSEALCGTATTVAGATNLPLAVPNPPTNNNPTFVTSTLQINDAVQLDNLSVTVSLSHTAGSDVVLRLITPWGATIPLLTGTTSVSSFLPGDYVFSDIGLRTMQEVNDGDPMPHRTYPAPAAIGPVVAGHSAQGTWTLSVGDDRRQNATGQVQSWSVTFHGACGCPADIGVTGGVPGSDGQLDNNDFVVFIDQFFAGCN